MQNSNGHPLKSGTFINARFDAGEEAPMLAIPKNALAEGLKDPYVFVVNSDSSDTRVSRRELVLGREVGDRVEVLQGLKPNKTVVISGQLNLVEGSKVRVTNSK